MDCSLGITNKQSNLQTTHRTYRLLAELTDYLQTTTDYSQNQRKMGATQSSAVAPVQGVDKAVIRRAMSEVFETFNSCSGGLSQTDLFKKIMSTKQEEFKAFDQYRLGEVFTDRGKCFPELKGSYNNTFLFRDSQTGVVHIPLRSNGKFTSMTPLGFPGRDLPQEWGLNASHFMTVKHKDFQAEGSGAWMFNAMLPTTNEEIKEFEEKVAFAEAVVTSLRENSPIKDCGAKVLEVAGRLGLGEDTPIRDYMAKAIASLPVEVRTGRPGFTLPDSEGNDISSDVDAVKSMIYEVFSDSNVFLMNAIQPTSKNSQVVSHLHTMLVRSLTDSLKDGYFDARTVIEVRNELFEERRPLPGQVLDESDEGDDCSLTRQITRAQ